MTTAQLERAVADHRAAAAHTYRDIAEAAATRALTADERATLGALLATSQAMRREMPLPSPGTQFVRSEGFEFFRRGGHRMAGVWQSPAVDVVAPPGMRAATITTTGLTWGQVEPMRRVFRPPTVAALCGQGRTSANAVLYPIEATLPVLKLPGTAENVAKTQIALGALQLWTAPVNKVAGYVAATEEQFEDVPGLATYIDSRLVRACDLAVDADILTQISTLPGRTPDYAAVGTNSQALLAQAVKIFAASGYIPDSIALHPYALWGTVAKPDGQELNGAFLFGRTEDGLVVDAYLFGMQLVATPAMPTPTTAIIGDFDDGATIYWKDDFAIEASNSYLGYFATNQILLRGERRYAFAPSLPQAFGLVTGLTVAT